MRSRPGLVLDVYGGPGGVAEGLRLLGLHDAEVGVEWGPWACATRRAAGHRTIRADATAFPLCHLSGKAWGLWMSPPCTMWSMAGKRESHKELPALLHHLEWGHAGRNPFATDGARCVADVLRWLELRPEWVCLEQVPPVLPAWEAIGRRLRRMGYSVWAGRLCAADVSGVPQERYRAILVASRERDVDKPARTHHPDPGVQLSVFAGPELRRWPTMADALGWEGPRGETWPWSMPATTICGDPRITARCHHDAGSQGGNPKTTSQVRAGDYEGTEPIKLTLDEATTLSAFPVDYPWQGPLSERWQQVGNAVPPPFAAHIVAEAAGLGHLLGV